MATQSWTVIMHVRCCYYCGRASAAARETASGAGWLNGLMSGCGPGAGRFEVILCALTGRLNLGPGVAGANKPLGDKGTRCSAVRVEQPPARPRDPIRSPARGLSEHAAGQSGPLAAQLRPTTGQAWRRHLHPGLEVGQSLGGCPHVETVIGASPSFRYLRAGKQTCPIPYFQWFDQATACLTSDVVDTLASQTMLADPRFGNSCASWGHKLMPSAATSFSPVNRPD